MSATNDIVEPKDEEQDEKEIPEDDVAAEEVEGAAEANSEQKPTKRRTKTGCLTCRRRRIKCGEERPTCKNCIKSKRECAGYVQPLVYKQHTRGTSFIQGASGRPDLIGSQQYQFNGNPTYNDTSSFYHTQNFPHPSQFQTYHPQYNSSSFSSDATPISATTSSVHSTPSSANPQHFSFQHFAPDRRHSTAGSLQYPFTPISPINSGWAGQPVHNASWAYISSHQSMQDQRSQSVAGGLSPQDMANHSMATQGFETRPIFPEPQAIRYNAHGFVQHPTFVTAPTVPTPQMPSNQAPDSDEDYEDPDDPWDVEMEDTYGFAISREEAEQDLSALLGGGGMQSMTQRRPVPNLRRGSKTVATYRPSLILSPLHDERNERIFYHYIEVTSKCLSVFERQPIKAMTSSAVTLWGFTLPAAAFAHPALAHSILALSSLHIAKLQNTSEDQALKHFTYAVRRVGKLLGLPKRRHEIATLAAVLLLGFYEVMGADHSRWNLHLAGATKLIVEHDFAGMTRTAKRMRERAKANILQWSQRFTLNDENYVRVAAIPEELLDDIEWEIDEDLVSQLTGLKIDYANQVQPHFERQRNDQDLSKKDVEEFKSKMDLRWWYCKQDVFQSMVSGDPLLLSWENWKYCPPRGQLGKIESLYGTMDHLVLIMARLSNFAGKDRLRKQRAVNAQGGQWRPPPGFFPAGGPARGPPGSHGPLSRPSPTDSSHSPAGSDKSANSNRSSRSTQAPSANEGRVRQSKPPPSAPPPNTGPGFHGMIPTPSGPIQMHSAFHVMDATLKDNAFSQQTKEKSPEALTNLEAATAKALEEHAAIQRAFDLFVQSLGPEFQELPPSKAAPIATPFGPALQYRSAEIACIWTFYNVGRILLHRSHPYMPPAAMMSVGVAAHLTAEYAQTVGKICGGIYAVQKYTPEGRLDPNYAGATMESSFSLLFAAIQYQNPAQRGWTISKLQGISRTAGWQSAASMAAACEVAWESMGKAGRGPPYSRTMDRNNKDQRVNGELRRSADDRRGSTSNASDTSSEHDSPFVNHDRNLISRHGPTRVHWALGLLSVEEDIRKMDLNKE